MNMYFIVCPLVFLAGFIDAVAGGGGLISLPAYLMAGLPAHNAIATNKMSSSMGTALATYRYAKSGYINWKRALICVICAFIGSSLGANAALMIGDAIFKKIMLVVLPVTAVHVMTRKSIDSNGEKEYSAIRVTAVSMASAFVIGIYDGFYGPGTGTFLILLLCGLAGMGIKEANGTTKVINLTTNIAALSVFIMNGKVIYPLGITAGLFSIAGNYLGTKYFSAKGGKSVKWVIVIVLVIFFIKIISEL